MPLTEIKCRTFKPTGKPCKLTDAHGLYLHVMPNGKKYWRLKYRYSGKEKVLALGVYPEVSLAEAREKRQKARKLLESGADPSFAKQDEKRVAAQNAGNTFEMVAREWHERQKARWTLRHARDILHRLEMDVFPDLGKRPIADITAPHVLDVLRQIEKRGAHEIAKRAMQTSGQVFRYAIVTGRAERNPAADLKGALEPVKHGHFAALGADELPAFLQVLAKNDARLYVQTRFAIQLMMLTFVRTSELIGVRWTEFDLENSQWVIPAERMKMRKPHIVPLSKQAVAILEELKKLTGQWEWVFPNKPRPRKHMSNNTILVALKRLGYKGRMTGHGFRALAMSTIKEKLGYRHEVVDRQLAHAPRNKIDAAYDRAAFLDDRRKMMQEWADYLDAAASGGKVVVGRFRKVA
jgi:integrase